MAKIPKVKLNEFFGLFEPELILGTTYTLSLAFFESVVWPSIKKKSKLRRCLILCDKFGFQRAVKESSALQRVAREYVVAVAPHKKAFHAKVWLMLNQDRLGLLVGSGNLTQSGFVENSEMFDFIELSQGSGDSRLVGQIQDFVDGLSMLWDGSSGESLVALDTLAEISGQLAKFGNGSDDGMPHFLHSFDGAFPDAVSKVTGDAEILKIISPYFGGSTKGLELLQSKMQPASTVVFPAVHSGDTIDVPASASKLGGTSLAKLKPVSGKAGFVHAKLYGVESKRNEFWTLTGSVNCTHAALSGANVEAGILRRLEEDEFKSYFKPDKKSELPTDQRHEEYESVSTWLTFWATDIGNSIQLTLAESAKRHFPLQSVNLRLSIGAEQFSLIYDSLNWQSGRLSIPWNNFDNVPNRRNSSVLIELSSTTDDGPPLRGSAFVDDLVSLTAEPVHRGAWRTTMSMLSAEGIPEIADLSHFFKLSSYIEVSKAEDTEGSKRKVAGTTSENSAVKNAIWPPVPMVKSAGTSPSGPKTDHIYWFNRILATMVSRSAAKSESRAVSAADTGDEGSENESYAITKRQLHVCKRVWNQADDAFNRMLQRLGRLVLCDNTAENVWGTSVYICLAALLSKSAVHSGCEGMVVTGSTGHFIKRYNAALFGLRFQQNPPNSTCRYQTDVFPAIASDLQTVFGLFPGAELVSIFLVFFGYEKVLSEQSKLSTFPLSEWLVFRSVAGDHLAESYKDINYLESRWACFLSDGSDGVTWEQMRVALNQLINVGWRDHLGVLDLEQLSLAKKDGAKVGVIQSDQLAAHISDYKRSGFKARKVDSLTDCCIVKRCPNRHQINPQLRRALRSLRPFICDSCGYLLVPEELYAAFKRTKKQ